MVCQEITQRAQNAPRHDKHGGFLRGFGGGWVSRDDRLEHLLERNMLSTK